MKCDQCHGGYHPRTFHTAERRFYGPDGPQVSPPEPEPCGCVECREAA